MYERKQNVLVGILSVFILVAFSSCRSCPNVVPNIIDGAETVTGNIDTIANGQADLAITGESIQNNSDRLAEGLIYLEDAIKGGASRDTIFAEILRAVYERPIKSSVDAPAASN